LAGLKSNALSQRAPDNWKEDLLKVKSNISKEEIPNKPKVFELAKTNAVPYEN